MSRWIDIDDDRNCYIGTHGEYERWNIDPEVLAEAESADRNGHWIYGEHEVAMCDGYRCDQCGFFITWDYNHTSPYFIEEYHFCPNCGSKMVREDGEA